MKIVCFGDSHGHYFRDVYPHLAEIETHTIDGATILGLGRRETTLNARDAVFDRIAPLAPGDYVCLKFGQVDVELGYYYRKVIKNEQLSFAVFSATLVEAYLGFVRALCCVHPKVVVCGINAPTIFNHDHAVQYTAEIISENVDDEEPRKAQMEALHNALPSIQDRTAMSVDFNAMLELGCRGEGVPYFDLTREALNPAWGLLSSKFRPFEVNHHYPLTYEIVEIFTLELIMTVKRLG